METKEKLIKRYYKICGTLKSLAWKEYEQGCGTQTRANTSRRCDGLSIEKRNLENEIFEKFNIEIRYEKREL